jgi:signal transduction histidine kinase
MQLKKILPADEALRDQNEELKQANEQLRKTNMELDNFVYSVSHNLRGPLASLMGLVNIARIENREKDPRENEVFNMMEGCIFRLEETMREILDYSRNSRIQPKAQMLDIKAIISTVTEKLKYLPNFSRLEKSYSLEAQTPIYSDAYRISIIFQNLISNAIKYQDTAKDKSYLRVHIAADQRSITLLLQDNGIGIAKDQLSFAFDMFHRATEKSDGAGLGLYIAKEAIEKLNGTVKLESKLNKGTTFTIALPNLLPLKKNRIFKLF